MRLIVLPSTYCTKSKKKNECLLALIACARLHKLKLLDDQFLPSTTKQVESAHIVSCLTKMNVISVPPRPVTPKEVMKAFVYPLIQSGPVFDQHDSVLKGNKRSLCLLSQQPFRSGLSIDRSNFEIGSVECKFGRMQEIDIDPTQWSKCQEFYSILMNFRCRGKRSSLLRLTKTNELSHFPTFTIACVIEDGTLDWPRIDRVISDYHRNDSQRRDAARGGVGNSPKLWMTNYDTGRRTIYMALNSHETIKCGSPFPGNKFSSFKEYFSQKRGVNLDVENPMFTAHHLYGKVSKQLSRRNMAMEEDSLVKDDERCAGLSVLFLPSEVAMEAPVSDAALYLHMIFLPEILYELERTETVMAFVAYCTDFMPVLGNYLDNVDATEIMEVMTARTCAKPISYDRIEYLGDAVLKLLQTDSLMYAEDEDLKEWLDSLEEGGLTIIRSGMGCNDRLTNICESAGIDPFILTFPFGRGLWKPPGLYRPLHDKYEMLSQVAFVPTNKEKADVIESLLGLVYLKFGYEASVNVGIELCISVPFAKRRLSVINKKSVSKDLVEFSKKFLGITSTFTTTLLAEATTHPSCTIRRGHPSYQRLEWVGDAVLCLFAREWVYNEYTDFDVKQLIKLETILICNETLALLGFSSGVQK